MRKHWNARYQGLRDDLARPWVPAVISGVLVAVALLPAWWWGDSWYKARLLADQRAHVATELSPYVYAVNYTVHQCLGFLEGTQVYVADDTPSDHIEGHLRSYLERVHVSTGGVCDFSLIPGGVQSLTDASSSGAGVLGRDIAGDEQADTIASIHRTMESRQISLDTWYVLGQDGLEWVAWLAVYQGDTVWGLVSARLRMLDVLDTMAASSYSINLEASLRDAGGRPLYGRNEVFSEEPVIYRIDLPEGHWEMAGIPIGGWESAVSEASLIFRLSGLGIIALLACLGGLIASRQAALEWGIRERTRELRKRNEELIENTHLIAVAQSRAALEERQRLARELHDSVSQLLYSLSLMAEAGHRLMAAGNLYRAQVHLGRIRETAQHALREMRLLVYELRPSALEREGLAGALQHRLDAVEKRAGIETHLEVRGVVNLPIPVEDALYRIAQEALNNSLKHSSATVVNVRIHTDLCRAEVEVLDDGRGFDPETLTDNAGMGLVSMRERAEQIRGSLSIVSARGRGTSVRISTDLTRGSTQGRVRSDGEVRR